MVTTAAAILANTRYTERQVQNRQPTDHDTAPPNHRIPHQRDVQRRGSTQEWVISERTTHAPLVTEEQFVAVQAIHTARLRLYGAGVLRHLRAVHGAHWVHGQPGYRCRHGRNSAKSSATASPKIFYVREDHLVDRIVRSGRLPHDLATGTATDTAAIGVYLQTRSMIIVCNHATWTIETETDVIPLDLPRDRLPAIARIPAQRDGDQPENEQIPHLVWK
jgi:site-specific DNA recombinase